MAMAEILRPGAVNTYAIIGHTRRIHVLLCPEEKLTVIRLVF